MPLYGTLKSMPLPDLLQWIGTSRASGMLQLELGKVRKSICLRKGIIVGCSSDDPPQKLGQFLLARGKIDEPALSQALQEQQKSPRHLGMILVDMNAIEPDDLTRYLEAQAEETIFSLFDWEDAVFRFDTEDLDSPVTFPVELRVEDILLRGLQRYDEMARIRETFHDPRIVLTCTGKQPPAEVMNNPMARTLFEAVDGERTLDDILLHTHGSSFVVKKFLYELHTHGIVAISGLKEPTASPAPAPAVAIAPEVKAVPVPVLAADEPLEDLLADWSPDEETRTVVALEDSDEHQLTARLEEVRVLMKHGKFETSLDILGEIYARFPGDESLRRLTAEAEAAFIDKAYRHYLPAHKIAVLTKPLKELESESFSPTEFFMISRLDGSWDIRSIIQIAPMREADALRTLKRLRENGVIELQDPKKS